MNVVFILSKTNSSRIFSVSVDATGSTDTPTVFETMYQIFSLKGMTEDQLVTDAIELAMTSLCLIAVSFSKVADITREHHIEN